MARGEEVKRDFPDRYTSAASGQGMPVRGGRNRIRGGAGDNGSHHDTGAHGPGHGKANGDALPGNYDPAGIRTTGGIELQYQQRDAGKAPPESGGPFDVTMLTQREQALANPAIGNDARPGSMEQGPEGNFGNRPGDESQRSAYISGN